MMKPTGPVVCRARTRVWPLAIAAALTLAATGLPGRAVAAAGAELRMLSSRADLISGGDALVEAVLPDGANPADATFDVTGVDVTSQFAVRANGKFEGLLTGLHQGANTLTMNIGAGGASITITNHPSSGPVLAGPQIQPWTCATGALNAQCDRAPVYTYQYMSSVPGRGFQPYDANSPPRDIATTTTDQGVTVPYIVQVETGAIDRDQYRIAVLFQPGEAWEPWAPQPQWNHKLVITHGASCDTSYAAGNAPDVMNATALGRGFAVMSNALDNAGHNCNIVTQGESLIMTKERVVETLGEIRYTIGSGCSGGSLVQQQLANAFPGLYQGITPQCSYPDAWSSAMQYEDYNLMLKYFENPAKWAPGVAWDPVSIGTVIGHPNPLNPVTFTTAIPDSGNPSRSCPGLDQSQVYNAQTNPNGVRCTLYDYMVNVFGTVPDSTFARIPWTNTGVQFGLLPLLEGKLTAAQFIDINTKIGGFDIDHNLIAARTVADPDAVDAEYRSGAINSANHLDEVAIIDLRGPDPGAFHDVYRTYALRARLLREHGTAANQALWRGFVPLLGDGNYVGQSIIAIDAWLAAVEADTSTKPLAQKIIDDRPAAAADRCTDGAGTELPSAVCDTVVQSYSTPRIQAGMPFTDDVMMCQLKPMNRADYYPVIFTDDQWSQLQTAFPNGVCDYSVPGQHQQGAVAWQTYQDSAGNVIYGGTPLGPPPVSTAF